jgi:hypothetical protein
MTEPTNDFEQAILQFCKDLGEMLIEKNRKYGDSYRNLRKSASNKGLNARMPLWLHQMEKLDRYMENKPDETEDIPKDGAGYWCLEAICSRFDDIRKPDTASGNITDYRLLTYENQNK